MIPSRPTSTPFASGTASLHLRYEDVTQDGRMQLASMMPGVGHALWARLPRMERAEGVLPILSRLILQGGAAPVSVHVPVTYSGEAHVAREEGGDRLFVLMWLEARAPLGSTFGPRPKGEPEVVGRVFAEHVVTKPFAPAAERRVTSLPGITPTLTHRFESAESLIERAALESFGTMTFGMMHTDSNQHVNSLVYPRVFEERLGRGNAIAHEIEIRFRKPFFSCDTAEIRGSSDGYGSFSLPGALKPNCTIRLDFA